METHKKNIPEIRFPEFMNDGEWRLDTIETIFNIRNGYTPSKANPLFWENGTIPWFRMEDIRKSGHILSDAIQHITPKAVKGSGLIPAYSIIVATTATIGEHALTIVDSLANQRFTFLTKCKSFESRIDMLYFHYFMFIIDEWCKRNTNAGGLLSVNMDSFKRLVVPYPPTIAEQKRIAECFYSLDKVIEGTRQKLEQLKAHKKGLMQKLFPAPGKSVPECRFKEFENAGEWEQLYIKDIFEFIPNNTLSRAELNYNIGNVKNIHYGDILTSFNEYLNTQKETIPFVTNPNLSEKLKRVKLNNGDIVIADTAEDETVGKCTEITNMQHIDTIVSGLHTIALHPTTKFATGFLGFFMNSESFRHQLLPLMQGVKVLSLSKKAIASCNIYYPMSFLEQKRIAECLTSLNDQICLYNDKLDILERHKQALRQRLFPTI